MVAMRTGTSESSWPRVTSFLFAVNQRTGALSGCVEAPDGSVCIERLDVNETTISSLVYFVLVLLTKSRALDKVQSAGEGGVLQTWRFLHSLCEPRVKSQ